MQEFDTIGEDLFNKIRGRFPEVTIGDEDEQLQMSQLWHDSLILIITDLAK